MKVVMFWCVVLVAIVSLASHVDAQQAGSVSGTLTDALSGDVIPNATVVLESPSFTRQVRSGPDGKYSLADVPPGMYHLIVAP